VIQRSRCVRVKSCLFTPEALGDSGLPRQFGNSVNTFLADLISREEADSAVRCYAPHPVSRFLRLSSASSYLTNLVRHWTGRLPVGKVDFTVVFHTAQTRNTTDTSVINISTFSAAQHHIDRCFSVAGCRRIRLIVGCIFYSSCRRVKVVQLD